MLLSVLYITADSCKYKCTFVFSWQCRFEWIMHENFHSNLMILKIIWCKALLVSSESSQVRVELRCVHSLLCPVIFFIYLGHWCWLWRLFLSLRITKRVLLSITGFVFRYFFQEKRFLYFIHLSDRHVCQLFYRNTKILPDLKSDQIVICLHKKRQGHYYIIEVKTELIKPNVNEVF